MLIVGLHGPSIPVNKLNADEAVVLAASPPTVGGAKHLPLIERIHTATKLSTESTIPSLGKPKVCGRGEVSLPPPVSTNHGFGDVVRTRRSALDFKGGASRSPSRNLRLSCPPQGSVCFADSLHIVTSIFIFTSIASKAWIPVFIASGRSMQSLERIKQGTSAWWRQPSVWDKTWGNACVAFSMIGDFENATAVRRSRLSIRSFRGGSNWPANVLAAEALDWEQQASGNFLMNK